MIFAEDLLFMLVFLKTSYGVWHLVRLEVLIRGGRAGQLRCLAGASGT
jgi:hypothetical protein